MRQRAGTAAGLIALFALALMARQFVLPGVYSCVQDDAFVYLNWSRQFAAGIEGGTPYPRWLADSHGGYGNPTFVFYPPLVVCVTALLEILTGDAVLSVTLVKLSGLMLSGMAMYVFARGLWGGRAGLVAAVVYMALPLRVYDVYMSGVFASRFAYVWFPLVLHFARRAVEEERPGPGMAGLALCYGLLCLTHLLSAYMFTPVLFAFGLAVAGKGRRAGPAARLMAASALGVGLAAFYILPALAERPLVHFEELLKSDKYDYFNNYVFFIFRPVSPLNPPHYGFLAQTAAASACAGLALYVLAGTSGKGRLGAFFCGVSAAALLMMSSLSGPFWEAVPGMKLLQYPMRWGVVLVFGLAGMAGAGVSRLDAVRREAGAARMPVLAAAAAVLALAVFLDGGIASRSVCFSEREAAAVDRGLDVYEYVPKGVSLAWLKGGGAGDGGAPVGSLGPGTLKDLDVRGWRSGRIDFRVGLDTASDIRVRSFYYPGWRATVDGVETAIRPEKVSGASVVFVPGGRHDVTLYFSNTPARVAAWILSAVSALFMLYLTERALTSKRAAGL